MFLFRNEILISYFITSKSRWCCCCCCLYDLRFSRNVKERGREGLRIEKKTSSTSTVKRLQRFFSGSKTCFCSDDWNREGLSGGRKGVHNSLQYDFNVPQHRLKHPRGKNEHKSLVKPRRTVLSQVTRSGVVAANWSVLSTQIGRTVLFFVQ